MKKLTKEEIEQKEWDDSPLNPNNILKDFKPPNIEKYIPIIYFHLKPETDENGNMMKTVQEIIEDKLNHIDKLNKKIENLFIKLENSVI